MRGCIRSIWSTGMITVQLAKKMGTKVIAVSKHNWIKDSKFGGVLLYNK